jgi:hypothetical protein
MVADWSVACSAEDPVLVVPWSLEQAVAEPVTEAHDSGQRNTCDFIDLRENPYDLDQIPEAEQYPPLMQALRALNAPRSPVFTAKCDAWPLDEEELNGLRLELDVRPDGLGAAAVGFASYIDLVWRDRTIFASFHQSEQLLHRLTRLAAMLDQPLAMLDCVLRPAMVDLTGPQEGFAISLYVKALARDADAAREEWGGALEAVVGLLRGKDFSG